MIDFDKTIAEHLIADAEELEAWSQTAKTDEQKFRLLAEESRLKHLELQKRSKAFRAAAAKL